MAKDKMMRPAEPAKARPVHEIRLGRVKAAVWANEGEHGLRHSVTIQRIYKDATGIWQRSDSFGREDLLLVAKVADLAHTWIEQQSNHGDARTS